MSDLLSTDASLDDVRLAVETDPQWSPSFPFGREERRTYQHAVALMVEFHEKTPLRVDIPTADYAGPATVDRMRLAAIKTINSARMSPTCSLCGTTPQQPNVPPIPAWKCSQGCPHPPSVQPTT